MARFLDIDHGFDNYEELIDVDEVIFIRASWVLLGQGNNKEWNVKTKIYFKNNSTQEIELTDVGYQALKAKIMKSKEEERLLKAMKDTRASEKKGGR